MVGLLIKKITAGTKEWASSNINIFFGCQHNCRYCYAKKIAIRFNRKSEDTWKVMELNPNKLLQNFRRRSGRIMFPTSHDIIPEFKSECFQVLEKILEVGNLVLITTKPHLEVIKAICRDFFYYKDLIQFRFTITSIDNSLLRFWEEGAPTFEERFESLKFAFKMNYKTSVSIEPFLDSNPKKLIDTIYPYISETIWIGKMNYISQNKIPKEDRANYKKIRMIYSHKNLLSIINSLESYKKVRYKDSIRKYDFQIPSYQAPKLFN